MTSVGDLVSVVMGSDGKYYAKSSSSVAVGDQVQAFIGSDGKWYASKSGIPTVGSNILTSIDSTGKLISHKSGFDIPDGYTYLTFGGGESVVYTLWWKQYQNESYELKQFFFIEKRDPITLSIIDVSPEIDSSGYSIGSPGLSQMPIGGDSRYFVTIAWPRYPSPTAFFNFYDSQNNWNLNSVPMVADIQNGFAELGEYCLSGFALSMHTHLDEKPHKARKYDVLTQKLLLECIGWSPFLGVVTFPSGPYGYFISWQDTNITPPQWCKYAPCDKYDCGPIVASGAAASFFIYVNIGYAGVIPTAIGSDICHGWRWDPTGKDFISF